MSSDRVFTLRDLDSWHFDGTALAVLGHPIAHSVSPAMHNAALAVLAHADAGFANWRYFKFDVEPSDLAGALPRFHACGFAGLNLTIPHKVLAVDLVKRIDPPAAEAGAVNTLRRLADGFEGFNTDGHGISRAVAETLATSLAGSAIVLLGAGGAARGAAVTCLHEGCRELWIGNRTRANLDVLLRMLAPLATRTGVRVQGFDLAHPPSGLPGDAVVINATSAGLKPGDPAPIDLAALPGRPRVYDMIYNTPQTTLLRDAAARGLRASGGVSMLVHQGARALELWTGRLIPVQVMADACNDALGRPRTAISS
jgi:shikimate dehydrogenase